MTELVLIRHGETDWNRELRFQGQADVPLNAVGLEQARRLGERLAGEALDGLVSSDLSRARQTAGPIQQRNAQVSMAGVVWDAALREQNFGVLEGLKVPDVQAGHPEVWAQWLEFQADFAPSGGESTRQFHSRVMAALRELAKTRGQQTLVVVTHGGVLDMVYRTALGLPLSGPRQSEIPNAGLNRVRIAGETVEIVSWADTQHLADLPAQPRYDQRALVKSRPAA
ncbi:MAG: histidine phosphatase family protein [Rhodoferax sp.]|nr:histidine phosphatase family protein [Rhodoferax sp.]